VILFHEAFLWGIKLRGRINEPLMMVNYKLRSGDFFSDMSMGIEMFLKGKLPLISPKTKNLRAVKDIFEKTRQ